MPLDTNFTNLQKRKMYGYPRIQKRALMKNKVKSIIYCTLMPDGRSLQIKRTAHNYGQLHHCETLHSISFHSGKLTCLADL